MGIYGDLNGFMGIYGKTAVFSDFLWGPKMNQNGKLWGIILCGIMGISKDLWGFKKDFEGFMEIYGYLWGLS